MPKHPVHRTRSSSPVWPYFVLGGAGAGGAILLGVWYWRSRSSASQAVLATPAEPSTPPPPPTTTPPPPAAAPPPSSTAEQSAAYLAGYAAFSLSGSVQQALSAWAPPGGLAIGDADLFLQGWQDRQQGLAPRYPAPAQASTTAPPPDPEAAQVAELSAKLAALQAQQQQTQAAVSADHQQLQLTVQMLQAEQRAVDWSLPGTSESAGLLVAAANMPDGPNKMQVATAFYQSQNADWQVKVAAYFGSQVAQYQSLTEGMSITRAAVAAGMSIASAAAAGVSFVPIAGAVISAALQAVNIITSTFYGPQNPVPWFAAGPGGFGASTQTFSPNRWGIYDGWAGGCYWCNGMPTVSWMIPRLAEVAKAKGPVTGGSAAQGVGPGPDPYLGPYGPYNGDALKDMAKHWPFGPPVPIVSVSPAIAAGYSWSARPATYTWQGTDGKSYSTTDVMQIGNPPHAANRGAGHF